LVKSIQKARTILGSPQTPLYAKWEHFGRHPGGCL
jgi:hypothetical protein